MNHHPFNPPAANDPRIPEYADPFACDDCGGYSDDKQHSFNSEVDIPAAAEYLDTLCPGWYDVIDLDSLDMTDTNNCILGQLFYGAISDFDYPCSGYDYAMGNFYELGDSFNDEFEYDVNVNEWIAEVQKRKDNNND